MELEKLVLYLLGSVTTSSTATLTIIKDTGGQSWKKVVLINIIFGLGGCGMKIAGTMMDQYQKEKIYTGMIWQEKAANSICYLIFLLQGFVG